MNNIQNKYITINQEIISYDVQKPEKVHSAESTLEKLKKLASFHFKAKTAAQEVYDNFNQTLGKCGRFINWIKSWFGLGEYPYIQKIDRIFSEVMGIKTNDNVDFNVDSTFLDNELQKKDLKGLNGNAIKNYEDLMYKINNKPIKKKEVYVNSKKEAKEGSVISDFLLTATKRSEIENKKAKEIEQELENANEGLSTVADGFRSIASGLSSGTSNRPGYRRKIGNGIDQVAGGVSQTFSSTLNYLDKISQ